MLSAAATTLLVETSKDPKRLVRIRTPIGKYQVSTNGQHFVDDKSVNAPSRYKEAVDELVQFGYLQPEGESLFQLTADGVAAAGTVGQV